MKKSLTTLIILSFCLLNTIPVLAQRTNKIANSTLESKNSIKYSATNAYSDGNGVWLEWETASEAGNLGFYIYRVDGDKKELLNPSLIPGQAMRGRETQIVGDKYNFFDPNGTNTSTYYIESLSNKGQKQTSDFIFPKYVADLKDVAGSSSETLQIRESKKASPFIVNEQVNVPPASPSENKPESSPDVNKVDFEDNTQSSIAAQPGVKIGVKKEGFYRVSRTELSAAGFNVDAPAKNWQLYKNGVEQAINADEKGEFIEFYGTGLDNRDTDTQIYFLIAGNRDGKRIRTIFRRPFAGNVLANNYDQTTTYKERTTYSDVLNGDELDNFFGRTLSSTPVSINFNLAAVDFSESSASVDITVQGIVSVPHQTKITLNGTDIGSINGNYMASMSGHFNLPTSNLREGTNTLTLSTLAGPVDYSLFDKISVNYAKRFQSSQNKLSFYLPNYKATYVDGFTSPNIRVFDISGDDNVNIISNLKVLPNDSNGFKVYLPSNRGSVLYAVEDSAVLPVDSIVKNNPSTLSTPAHNANLIIISYKDWMDKANDWAAYRRAQGMTVEVVNVEDVYDEFSFGNFSTGAIGGFLKYAYDNWQTRPGYVLLMGDATYNPRNYADGIPNSGSFNYVPTKIIETLYIETGSDEAMADFNNDGLAEIPIGRLPIHNGQQVTDILNKVTAFESTVATQNLSRGVLFASDVPNGYDFEGVSNRLRTHLAASVPAVMVNKGTTDSHTNLITELNKGKFLANYSGHGNAGAWSASPVFLSLSDAAAMTNTNSNLTIFTMLTCLNGYFVQPNDTLSDVLIEKQNGGAVAVWASTGLTTPDIQEIMATRFFDDINSGNYARMGDLIKEAKTAIPAGRDVRLSWALIGDPTLKIK